tara:strand:- start:873 stop:1862 length:990 start_codon:yes stop_codon:yes gene_type:complete
MHTRLAACLLALAAHVADSLQFRDVDLDSVMVPGKWKDANCSSVNKRPLRVLLTVPYPERLHLLLDKYSAGEWACVTTQLIIMVSPETMSTCNANCADGRCVCAELPEECDSRKIAASRRMHNLLLAPYADGSSDLLFAHSDMWLGNQLARSLTGRGPRALDRDAIWLPGRDGSGFDSGMLRDDELMSSKSTLALPGGGCFDANASVAWDWWESFAPKCAAAQRRDAPLRALGVCCFAWVDLLYLPKAKQQAFAALATGGLAEATSHEGAIATIVAALTMHGATGERSGRVQGVGCHGGCCQGASLDYVRNDTLCMHRVVRLTQAEDGA